MALSIRDYQEAAEKLCLATAKIRAVDDIESQGSGFLESGEPKILFEAHWFSRFTDGKYNKSHPNISSPRWNRSLYEGGQAEHKRLQKAAKLNRTAALKSASWGKFQIMGYNWSECGFRSLQEFINAMYDSEKAHLGAFIGFMKSQDLVKPLKDEDWSTFARRYNGPSYAQNDYHTKLKEAFEKFSK
jgi:hypothetical protein